jgi:energy-coupling factor transporter transmembrane protein EcfT
MNRRKKRGRISWNIQVLNDSPLRDFDPRTKLVLSLSSSLAIMLPLEQLVAATLGYILLLSWARVINAALQQIWRIKWLLLGVFVIDWIFISLELAISITLRLSLLTSTFSLFFSTTTPAEFRLALEALKLPYRYAFSLSLAFQNLTIFDRETQLIREAQRSRGAWQPPAGWKKLIETTKDLISLTVPSIVMTTKRAWTMTEAAYARGFNSPKRNPYKKLRMQLKDWIIIGIAICAGILLVIWRQSSFIQ